MMKGLPLFIVDAFSSQPFGGNPAAVCLLADDKVMDDDTRQKVAAEMNLSETAFVVVKSGCFQTSNRFSLRWFTPTNEVALCGHATLASAAVIFNMCKNDSEELTFETMSGQLTATRQLVDGQLQIEMTFPLNHPYVVIDHNKDEQIQQLLAKTLPPSLAGKVMDLRLSPTTGKLLVCVDIVSLSELESMPRPEAVALLQCETGGRVRGVIVTAAACKDQPYDFVSRYFSPWNGIPEDPVTGSAHTVSGPYWAEKLSKRQLRARQCSPRGGDLWLTVREDSISLRGTSRIVVQGQFDI